MNLPDFNNPFTHVLDQALKSHAQKTCIRFKGESLSYAEVDQRSAQVANALLESGFKPGMKGAVYSLNSADGFITTLGIIRAGGVWIPVNPRNSPKDNVAIMLHFGCDAIFYQSLFEDAIAAVMEEAESSPIVVALDIGGQSQPLARELDQWLSGVSKQAPAVELAGDDLISIPQTGGTTGLPKGVMLSHANFCALDYGMSQGFKDRESPVFLCAAPMTHVGGRIAISSLSSGCCFVILDKVDLQEVLSTIESEKVTDAFLPPTAIYTLLEQPNLEAFDLSSLCALAYGSAPISTDKLREALRRLGPVMQGGYSQTECPMFITNLPPQEHFIDGHIAPDSRLKSVGRAAVISQVAILNEAGEELPAGERGEIAVKGPMVSVGYYNNPEETAKIRLNGWHLTGDIGFMDEEGYVSIVDRKKDMIITGGFNVYSAEVEQGLMAMPGIKVAIVIGVPSEKWGEEVKAFVQLEEGVDIIEDDIVAVAKQNLGGVKAPKSVEFVKDFPRTPIGKIDKKALRSPYWRDRDVNV